MIPAGKDPAKDKALKYGQTYPHKSPTWKGYYALRNTVESQNAFINDSATEDIDSPLKRRARGNTFASLAVTLALVSANIRKILTFNFGSPSLLGRALSESAPLCKKPAMRSPVFCCRKNFVN